MLRGGQVDDVEDHQVLGPCPKSELGRVGQKSVGLEYTMRIIPYASVC